MPANGSPTPGISSKGDIDQELFLNAQAYLARRSQHLAPSSHLVEAWEQFYRICSSLIRRFAVACRVPRASLDDCVQQVWTELVSKLSQFRYDPRRCQFRSWLYLLVHSKAIDLIRTRTRHPVEHLSQRAEAALCGRDGDPAAEYERHRKSAAVRRILAELSQCVSPPNYRVVYLRWIEGRTVQEVASALGLTRSQVWLREHRMKRKFRRLFNLHTGNEWHLTL